MNIRKFIPKPIKYILTALYVFVRTLLCRASIKKPGLNLADILSPAGSKKIVHGGKVKLLHLRERFGDTWRRFNIVYFVSSALPFAPALWIKIFKLFGVKVIWNQNGVAYPALYPPETVSGINGILSSIHLSDYVVYQSKFCQNSADKYLGVFKKHSSVIYNPVDIHHFIPRATPLPIEPLVIIMTGNHLESEERVSIALRAIKQLRGQEAETRLIIIGKIDRDFNEEWIEKRGAFTQEEAPALFQSAHILLHLKYLDPCPTIVLEAMACGLPVIGSASGGTPELVDEKSGVLISVAEDFEKLHYPSADEVVDAIKKIRSNYLEYSKSARGRSIRFDKEQWLKKHEEIFHDLLK